MDLGANLRFQISKITKPFNLGLRSMTAISPSEGFSKDNEKYSLRIQKSYYKGKKLN